METKGSRRTNINLPTISQTQPCDFEGYDAISLMTVPNPLMFLLTKCIVFDVYLTLAP
jgi:hypothetical protein